MSFDVFDLDARLTRALSALSYTHPTQVQTQSMPAALAGYDILVSAPTGTGKTAAYLIPSLQYLLDTPRRKRDSVRVLILTPTRELALQVAQLAKQLATFTKLQVAALIGGIDYKQQERTLTEGCDVMVATPGRLLEYLNCQALDCQQIDILILDEADRMLDMGFSQAMYQISGLSKNRRQTWLSSATLDELAVVDFAQHVLTKPKFFDVTPPRRERKKIQQWVHLADSVQHKRALLVALLQQEQVQRAVIFVKTREHLNALSAYLHSKNITHATLRGETAQEKRIAALEQLRGGVVDVLIATDVAARGIDLPDITHVINYDMPRTADVYVHRIGRTARAGAQGCAVSLVEAHEMLILRKIERYTQQRLKRRTLKGLESKHKEAKVPAKKKKKKQKKA